MLTKPDMWESEEFRKKFSKIPKSLQGQFLKAIQELYRQESESMLRFIQMSRESLRAAGIEIRNEQEALQLTSEKLSEERQQRRSKRPDQTRKDKPKNAVGPPPAPVRSTKVTPLATPPTNNVPANDNIQESELSSEDEEQFFKEETEQILRAQSRADNVHASERARQLEKVEKMKKERRAKKEADKGKAEQLIREASALEKQRTEAQKKQEDAVKAKLEERRKQKSELTKLGSENGRQSTLPDVDVHTDRVRTPTTNSTVSSPDHGPQGEPDIASAPSPPDEDPEDPERKSKKKKKDKKKKKKKEKEPLPSDSPV